MERAVALKKLGKILGKSLGYRVDLKAPDQDERDEAMATLREEGPKRDAISKQMEERRLALLQADPEYQRLKAAHAEVKKRCDDLLSISCRYRFTVGTTTTLFFTVKAQGDSWEQVIAKLTTEKQAA